MTVSMVVMLAPFWTGIPSISVCYERIEPPWHVSINPLANLDQFSGQAALRAYSPECVEGFSLKPKCSTVHSPGPMLREMPECRYPTHWARQLRCFTPS